MLWPSLAEVSTSAGTVVSCSRGLPMPVFSDDDKSPDMALNAAAATAAAAAVSFYDIYLFCTRSLNLLRMERD